MVLITAAARAAPETAFRVCPIREQPRQRSCAAAAASNTRFRNSSMRRRSSWYAGRTCATMCIPLADRSPQMSCDRRFCRSMWPPQHTFVTRRARRARRVTHMHQKPPQQALTGRDMSCCAHRHPAVLLTPPARHVCGVRSSRSCDTRCPNGDAETRLCAASPTERWRGSTETCRRRRVRCAQRVRVHSR
jgi:hypothetical protein